MTASARADKLFSALSAKERALLVLRAWKERGEEDRQVRATIPPDQGAEFNRYIELMNAANEGLGIYLVVVRANVEQLGLIVGWLATIKLWSIHSFELGLFIFRSAPEPITATDYERVKRTSRRRNPRPDRALKYEVYPDAQVKRVEQLAQERANIMNSFRRVPFGDFQDPEEAEPPKIEIAFRALVGRLKRQVPAYWRELRAAETLLDDAAAIFGEDPAIPEIRAIVVWLREELTSLHETLKTEYLAEVALSEPDEEGLRVMRKIAGWPETKPAAGGQSINARL